MTDTRFKRIEKKKTQELISYDHSVWKDIKKELFSNKIALVSIIILLIIIIASILAPLSPYDPNKINVAEKLQGISAKHIFGTDEYGRDYFTRALYGGRISLTVGFCSMIMTVILGTAIGITSGYFGGKVDLIMMRIVDIVYSLPDMLIIILLSVVFQERLKPLIEGTMFEKLGTNMISMFIVFGLLYWVSMARLIRGQILTIKNNEYVLAARCIGTRNSRILTRHILPNCLSVIIITTALQVPSAIFTESYLSFLGLGVSAPLTSLGSLANDARSAMQSYPYRLVIPAVLICLIVLALNLLGDGLRDAFDSKLN